MQLRSSDNLVLRSSVPLNTIEFFATNYTKVLFNYNFTCIIFIYWTFIEVN